MKQAYLFLDELPEWLKALAIANIEKCPLEPNMLRQRLDLALCVMFSWDNSNEGRKYWLEITQIAFLLHFRDINPKTYTEWPKP